MPAFTAVTLETLLNDRISGDNSSTLKSSTKNPPNQEHEKLKSKRFNHVFVSPALYTTPEPTPILDYSSSESASSSPYVFNRKGRGGGKPPNRRIDGFEVQLSGNGGVRVQCGEDGDDENGLVGEGEDPLCDSMSVASSNDCGNGRLGFENMSLVSNQIGEFYDAIEDFSSDGSMLSVASCVRNLELELQNTKLNLIVEIEKRKAAEDYVAAMFTHWRQVSKFLLSSSSSDSGPTTRFDINAVKQLSEEVIVARFVAEAIGKAEAKAEAELAAQAIIESKDKEICRLRDRMQYCEAMIHEMSQNNLESMEAARRQRERKGGQRKWLWGCIGVSIAIGASVIAYSYAPHGYALENVGDTQPEAAYD